MSLHIFALQRTLFENLRYESYSEGTAQFRKGADGVTASSGVDFFEAGVKAGDFIRVVGTNKNYEIKTVILSTFLTLTKPFEEDSALNVPFVVLKKELPIEGLHGRKLTGVFNYVEENRAFPYVVIGDVQATNVSPKDFDMHECVVTIYAWSDERGYAEVKYIDEQIYELLNDKNPYIYNSCIAYIRHEFSTVRTEQDGLTIQSINRYRIWVQDQTRSKQ